MGPRRFNDSARRVFQQLGIELIPGRPVSEGLILPSGLRMTKGSIGYTFILRGDEYVAAICWSDNDPNGQWGARMCQPGTVLPPISQPWPDSDWAMICREVIVP